MVTMITAPAPFNGDNSNPQGHCSQCRKIWTLNERQGVCPWCGKPASCIKATSKPRHVKSRSNGKRKQLNGNGNGYDQLPEPYLTYYKVALPFSKSIPPQDSGDLLHTIISNLADAGRSNGHKPDNHSWMYRIASFTKAQYWREHYSLINGLDCGRCSNKQRRKCKEDNLYTKCPKAVKVESLNKPVIDGEGNLTELGELIADDNALPLDAWLDYKTFLLTSPERLLLIGEKIQQGEALTEGERQYLSRWRRQEQKKLL